MSTLLGGGLSYHDESRVSCFGSGLRERHGTGMRSMKKAPDLIQQAGAFEHLTVQISDHPGRLLSVGPLNTKAVVAGDE